MSLRDQVVPPEIFTENGIPMENPGDFETNLREEMNRQRALVETVISKPGNGNVPAPDYPESFSEEEQEACLHELEGILTARERAVYAVNLERADPLKKVVHAYLFSLLKEAGKMADVRYLQEIVETYWDKPQVIFLIEELIKSSVGTTFLMGNCDQKLLKVCDLDLFRIVLSQVDQFNKTHNYNFLPSVVLELYFLLEQEGEEGLNDVFLGFERVLELGLRLHFCSYLDHTATFYRKVASITDEEYKTIEELSTLTDTHFDHDLDLLVTLVELWRTDGVQNVMGSDPAGYILEHRLERNRLPGIFLFLAYGDEALFLERATDQADVAHAEEDIEAYLFDDPWVESLLEQFVPEKPTADDRAIKNARTTRFDLTQKYKCLLEFLSHHSEYQNFIREFFAPQSLEHLAMIVEVLLKGRERPGFVSKLRSAQKYMLQVDPASKGKITSLVFFRDSLDSGLFAIMEQLFVRLGLNVLEPTEFTHFNVKPEYLASWIGSEDVLDWAIDKQLLTSKDTNFLYCFERIQSIRKTDGFLDFLTEHEDIGLLNMTLLSCNDSAWEWFENRKELFEKAKAARVFEGSSTIFHKFDTIEAVFADPELRARQDRLDAEGIAVNLFPIAVVEEFPAERSNVWRFCYEQDGAVFDRALRWGFLGGRYDIANNNIQYFDRLEPLTQIVPEQEEAFEALLDVCISSPHIVARNLSEIIAPKEFLSGIFALNTFRVFLLKGKDIPEAFPITTDNLLEHLPSGQPLIPIEKDRGLITDPIPWTKEWFEEDKARLQYLNKTHIETFQKFGTTVALGILGGTEHVENVRDFYDQQVSGINHENARSRVLELGEVLSVLVRDGKYHFFDALVEDQSLEVGATFQNFVEQNAIGDKGKTILTLLFVRAINAPVRAYSGTSDQFLGEDSDFLEEATLEKVIRTVCEDLKRYDPILQLYDSERIPKGLRVSGGIEYEVTRSIAAAYNARTGSKSDYKGDIEILSCYGGIARGNDAVHEIASRPTDNPYLLVLEMKLLEDLGFVDLNFKTEGFERGARGCHLSFGGEYGVAPNANGYFVQNLIQMSDFSGINAGREVRSTKDIYGHSGSDREKVFEGGQMDVTEYKGMSIDKAESFERCVVSMWNLHIGKQALEKYFDIADVSTLSSQNVESLDAFRALVSKKKYLKSDSPDDHAWVFAYLFVKLQVETGKAIEDHSAHFWDNEALPVTYPQSLRQLIRTFTAGAGAIKQKASKYIELDIEYLMTLSENFPENADLLFLQLQADGRFSPDSMPARGISRLQRNIYLWCKKSIVEPMRELREDSEHAFLYDQLPVLFADMEVSPDLERRLTNTTRFESVAGDTQNESVRERTRLNSEDLFRRTTPDFLNRLTYVHNLFLKPPAGGKSDSVNAASALETTMTTDGPVSDIDALERTVFDCVERGKPVRDGRYVIQGGGENMLIHKTQELLLQFNRDVQDVMNTARSTPEEVHLAA